VSLVQKKRTRDKMNQGDKGKPLTPPGKKNKHIDAYASMYRKFNFLCENCKPSCWEDVDVTFDLEKCVDDDAYQCLVNTIPWIYLDDDKYKMFGYENDVTGDEEFYLQGNSYQDFFQKLNSSSSSSSSLGFKIVRNPLETFPESLLDRIPIIVCIYKNMAFYVDTEKSGYAKNVCKLLSFQSFYTPPKSDKLVDASESSESIDASESSESINASESSEPINASESSESIKASESIEFTDTSESNKSVEFIGSKRPRREDENMIVDILKTQTTILEMLLENNKRLINFFLLP